MSDQKHRSTQSMIQIATVQNDYLQQPRNVCILIVQMYSIQLIDIGYLNLRKFIYVYTVYLLCFI